MIMKHTPGRWGWFGDAKYESLYLATRHSGRTFVMDFARWGMARAQPRFRFADRGMVQARDLVKFEVGPKSIVGLDAAKADPGVYRYDVSGIAHPDACLIAAAPCLFSSLENIMSKMKIGEPLSLSIEEINEASLALARAKGLAP